MPHLFVLSQVDEESEDTPVGCEHHEVQKQNVLEEQIEYQYQNNLETLIGGDYID